MLELLATILLILCGFMVTVGLVSCIMNKSLYESRIIVLNFIKEIFGLMPQEETYPIFLGYEDGVANVRVIEEAFEELKTIFVSFYLANSYYRDGIIVYTFAVGMLQKDIDDVSAKAYIESVVESIIHRFLHRNVQGVGKIANLVAIDYDEAYLKVYVATTKSATDTIARYKEHTRKWQQENEMKQNNTSKKSIEI